eukprot:7235-Heterococcus_DN1.PRE.2
MRASRRTAATSTVRLSLKPVIHACVLAARSLVANAADAACTLPFWSLHAAVCDECSATKTDVYSSRPTMSTHWRGFRVAGYSRAH